MKNKIRRSVGLFVILLVGKSLLTPTGLAQECPESLGRWPYGPTMAVAASGNHAYFGSGTVLQIADVSGSGMPQLVGEVTLPNILRGVTVSGGYAYVADDTAGLRVIDVNSPTSPIEVGFLDTRGSALGVVVSDGFAYLADEYLGLRVIDISSPTSPTEIGFVEIPGVAARGVAVSGHTVYVAGGPSGGLRVIDVSSPASPTEIGFVETPGSANGLSVSGNFAFVTDGYEGLRVIDVSSPAAPSEVGFYDTPGAARDVKLSGDTAYIADDTRGLRVIDVSNPASPTEVGFCETAGYAYDLALSGGTAYVATWDRGLRVIDVGWPSSPTEIGSFDTPGWAFNVAASGDYSFITGDDRGLRVIDVRSPTSPTEAGFFETTGYDYDVAVSGTYGYLTAWDRGLQVLDLSTPASITELGDYDTPGNALGVAVSGHTVFVADQAEGLRVIDVSTPAAPHEVGFCSTPGNALAVAVFHGYAYVAAANSGLRVIDVRSPASPSEVGFCNTPGGANDVAVAGGYAYVAAADSGLRVIDVRNPASPSEVGFIDTPGNAYSVAVAEGFAYIADGPFSGLRVIDIRTPSSPIEVGSYETAGTAHGVAVAGGHVFVAEQDAGMEIFLQCNSSSPEEPTRIYIPAAGTGNGAGDSLWSTDVVLNNVTASQLRYEIHYLEQDQNNSNPVIAGPVELEPGVSVLFTDVLSDFFGVDSGNGALRFEFSGDATALLMSRTKNTDADGATFGQGIPPIAEENLIPEQTTVRLVQLTENSDLRTNIGFMNGSNQAIAIDVQFYSRRGTNLGSDIAYVNPYSYTQWNRAFNRIGKYNVVNGYVDIRSESEGARFCAFASVVDERKGDPTYVFQKTLGGETYQRLYIPGSGVGPGAGTSLWSTDVVLNNSGGSSLTYRIHYLAKGIDNTSPLQEGPFVLNPGVSVGYSNVLENLFGISTGSGALRFELEEAGSVILMSRTKSTDPDGATFGQGIPAISEDELITAGSKVRLIQLAENGNLRTNIGFMNGSDISVTIHVEFFNESGTSLGVDSIALLPYSFNQWNRAFTRVSQTRIDNGYVDVWTTTPGGLFYTYGSVVDELKGDPTYVSPQGVQ